MRNKLSKSIRGYILNQFYFNLDAVKLTARNLESNEDVSTKYNDIYMLEPRDTEFDNYQIIENMANMAVPAENMYSIVKHIYRKEQSVGKELDENEIVIICAEIYEEFFSLYSFSLVFVDERTRASFHLRLR